MSIPTTVAEIAAPLLILITPAARALPQSGVLPDPNRPVSVLVLDVDGNDHQLTSPANGVLFDIDGTGKPLKIGWTAAGADDGFLFLDTNSNGRVDSGRELIGDGWRLPDGSRSASVDTTLGVIQGFKPPFSNPLPQGFARIAADDEVFARLRVWQDRNHDGTSTAEELSSLAALRVYWIPLSFIGLGRVPDAHGNTHNFGGRYLVIDGGAKVQRKMTDITLAREK